MVEPEGEVSLLPFGVLEFELLEVVLKLDRWFDFNRFWEIDGVRGREEEEMELEWEWEWDEVDEVGGGPPCRDNVLAGGGKKARGFIFDWNEVDYQLRLSSELLKEDEDEWREKQREKR